MLREINRDMLRKIDGNTLRACLPEVGDRWR